MKKALFGVASGVVALGAGAASLRADIVEVSVNGNFFRTETPGNPGFGTNVTVVNLGDTVRWTWVDVRPHSVTSVMDELFDSGILGPGGVFTFTFTELGDFDYICIIHGQHDHGSGQSFGMFGMVQVVPAAPTACLAGVGLLAAMRRRR